MLIPVGKGVCATWALTKKALCISGVHQFDDHIACDSSRFEKIATMGNAQVYPVV